MKNGYVKFELLIEKKNNCVLRGKISIFYLQWVIGSYL